METISNSVLTVGVSEHGAELQSIQKNGKEYLWQGDTRFWGRRSPVLFPIVGRVWEDTYRYAGNSYRMGQHGFARDMDFKVTYKGEDGIVYWLESTPETLDMYFQIGAHPAFNFPGFDASVDERGFFAFDSKEELRYIVPVEKGCVSPELHTLERDVDGLMKIDTHTFDCDTYIFQDAQLKKVTLLDRKKQPHISLEFDTPLVALWSPAKAHPDCPFVCIEPWYGRCDAVGFDGELKDREWIQKLGSKEVFDVSYSIIIEK